MRTLSTGQPSTLKSYLTMAKVIGPKAEAFIQKKIDAQGENEEVVAEEGQMLYLLAQVEFK